MKGEIVQYQLNINDEDIAVTAKSSATLQEVIRENLGLTGTKHGCDGGECGGCTVLIDGKMAYSCMMLALDARDKKIITIEGLAKPGRRKTMDYSWPPGMNHKQYEGIGGGELNLLQEKTLEHGTFQCGFCVPGRILAGQAVINEYGTEGLTEELIKHELAGHLCRCGYGKSVEAILDAADEINRRKMEEKGQEGVR